MYNVIAMRLLGIRRFLSALEPRVINAEWCEVSRNLLRRTFFPSRLIALFLLLFHFFSRFTRARARLCSSRRCARRLFPRCLPQGVWARGDPDREIVGIRGVTRGDLVLVHNGSICLRSSCRTWASSNARGLLPVLFQTCPYPHRENTSRIFSLWDVQY